METSTNALATGTSSTTRASLNALDHSLSLCLNIFLLLSVSALLPKLLLDSCCFQCLLLDV
ncbi:hypothetical protein Fmac_023310 [Flemingia macrophylla]|uniref:Uncharacterized protein n=1 Tax=Flemingia macrophylla TaxID=520843 RepID=A0ABD1LL52_9FABA